MNRGTEKNQFRNNKGGKRACEKCSEDWGDDKGMKRNEMDEIKSNLNIETELKNKNFQPK